MKIKVCCIASLAEATLAVEAGAAALGLVSDMPTGPGVIGEEQIAEIAAAAPAGVDTFLLTSLQASDAIIAQHARCGTTTIQLVDAIEAGGHAVLRAALSGVSIVQVIHVTGPDSVDEALVAAPHVDALLLDSGNPALAAKELGGTGRVHEWAVSRRIREQSPAPVFLAGGLGPRNVAAAVEAVRPHGVDVCSGLRTDGRLDPVKLDAFVAAATGGRTSPG